MRQRQRQGNSYPGHSPAQKGCGPVSTDKHTVLTNVCPHSASLLSPLRVAERAFPLHPSFEDTLVFPWQHLPCPGKARGLFLWCIKSSSAWRPLSHNQLETAAAVLSRLCPQASVLGATQVPNKENDHISQRQLTHVPMCVSASCFSYTSTASSRTRYRGSSVWIFVPESPLHFFLFLITRSLRSTWPRGGWLQWVTWQSSIPEIGKRSARTMWRFRQRTQWVKSLLGSSFPFQHSKALVLTVHLFCVIAVECVS